MLSDKTEKGGPKIVEVGYKIKCISNVVSELSVFEIDIQVQLYWNDPETIGLPNKSLINFDDSSSKKYFNPQIVVSNQSELREVSRSNRLEDSKTGRMKCSVEYRGIVFITGMNLAAFPFDYQNFNFYLIPHRLACEEVMLKSRPKNELVFDRSQIEEWRVLGHFARRYFTDPKTSTKRKKYSVLMISVLARRNWEWYFNNVIVITGILVFYSWTSYLVNMEDQREKLEIIGASVLTTIANKFVVKEMMIKTGYRTFGDIFVEGCFYLEILSLCAAFAVEYTLRYTDYDGELAKTVNIAMFLLNFMLFVGLCVYLYWQIHLSEQQLALWHKITQDSDLDFICEELLDEQQSPALQEVKWILDEPARKARFYHV